MVVILVYVWHETSRPDITDLNNKIKKIIIMSQLLKPYFPRKRRKFKTFITSTIIQNPKLKTLS